MVGRYLGKVAAVTGGTSGVGEAVARTMAMEGAAGLTIAGRDETRGTRIAAEPTGSGCPTQFLKVDLQRVSDSRAVVRRRVDRYGRIDGLANCAGTTERSILDDLTPELFDR